MKMSVHTVTAKNGDSGGDVVAVSLFRTLSPDSRIGVFIAFTLFVPAVCNGLTAQMQLLYA